MPRIVVETLVPVGMDIQVATALAKQQAAEAFGIHIVESTLLPLSETMPNPEFTKRMEELSTNFSPIGTKLELPDERIPSPNDGTVARLLTTTWDFHQ